MRTDEVYPQARVGPDGELNFPHRGNPPKVIQGYTKDPTDPYTFRPIIGPCIHRETFWTKVCGGQKQCITCKLFHIKVHWTDCKVCEDRQ